MSAPRGVFAALVSFLVAVAAVAATVSAGYAVTPVSWPPSPGLLLAEIVTGGVFASDEFVEIANAAGVPLDLNGMELVYVTASGSTVSRKAGFASPWPLAPGQHILLANGAGMYGPLADVTYSGGIAAGGGSLALRYVGGSIVDAVGWGTATNSFVEGSVAPAPAAGSSIERRPGGADGNWLDTNDNRADWLVQPNPVPQSLSSAPTPGASSSPSIAAGSEPPASMPTAAASPSLADETAPPHTTATPEPPTTAPATKLPTTAPATEAPTEAPPSATSTGGPSPSASASATPGSPVWAIADARAQADGAAVTVEGVLSTRLAALEGGHGGFMQDSTGGIAIYLAQVPAVALPAGTRVRVAGTLDDRYDQRTIRANDGGLVAMEEAALPEPRQLATGGAGEADEGIMVAVSGTVTDTPDALSDGLGISVDDGSGPLRVVAAPPAIGDMAIVKGSRVMVVGPLGQRVSGSSPGYRVEVTEPGSIVALPDASPSASAGVRPPEPTGGSPTPIAAATPSPSPTEPQMTEAPPSATSTGGPSPSASASATPGSPVWAIADARAQADGAAVTVEGVLSTRLAALEGGHGGFMQDSTGGIAIYLAQVPAVALPAGTRVRVAGTLDDRYDQRTIRANDGGLVAMEEAALPEPRQLATGGAGEADEGIMVAVSGTVTDTPDALSDGLGISVDDGSGPLRVVAAPPAIGDMAIVKGSRVMVVGPLGQRVSGSSPGYRVEVTEPGSIVALPDASPSASAGVRPPEPTGGSPTPIAAATPSPSPTEPGTDLESIATARTRPAGASVHVAGVATVAPGVAGTPELLAIEDSSGGIFVRLAGPIEGLEPGRSIEVVGALAAPYGQLEVREVQWLSLGSQDAGPAPIGVRLSDIGEPTEGSLVMVRGTVDSVRTDSGRLTLAVGDGSVEVRALADPSTGLTRADVSGGDLVELIGIVGQRASATGRADGYRLWLRSRSDLAVLPQSRPPAAGSTPAPSEPAVRHDLASALGDRGSIVDVDATVTAPAGLFDLSGPTIAVDDGTAAVAVILPPEAADLRVGSRIQIIGRVGRWEGGPTVVASQIVVEGDLQATPPLQVAGLLGPELEWRLVRVCGRIDRLTRAGSRWRAELLVNGQRVIVLGEPGAGISAASMTAGRLAVVTGVVRRSTSDSSVFQLLPRSPLDVRLGPAPEALSGLAAASLGSPAAGDSRATSLIAAAPRVDIGALADHIGERVTVSGLVADSDGRQATVDDGTGEVRLGGPLATEAISLLEPGDAIEVAGIVAQDEIGLVIVVDPMSVVTLPGDGGDRPAATEAAVGLRAPGSAESRDIGRTASVHAEASVGTAGPGVVGAIVLVLLAVVVAALGAARQARRRAGSFVPSLFAAGRRVGHLPRPARPTLGLGMLSRPSWRIRKPGRREAPDPSGQLADELRKRG